MSALPAKIQAVNEGIAKRATLIFGSMWAFYVFACYGLLPLAFPKSINTLLYWSNVVQLVALPLLAVGANVIGRAAETRAQETHDAVLEELAMLREEHAAKLAGIHERLDGLADQIDDQQPDGER